MFDKIKVMKKKEIIDKIQELYNSKQYDEIITFYSKIDNNKETALPLIERVKSWKTIDTNAVLIVFKAILFLNIKDYHKSLELLKKAIKLNVKYARAYNIKGVVFECLKEYEKSIEAYDKAISLDPDYNIAYTNKGISLSHLKEYKKSIEAYDRAININPKVSDVYCNKGVSLSYLKEYEKAIEAYDKAIALNPRFVDAYNNKGVSLYNFGHYEKSIEAYDKAISLNPKYARAYRNKGLALMELNQKNKAIASLNKFLSLSSDSYLNELVKEEIKNIKESNSEINILEKQIEVVKDVLKFDGDLITHYSGLFATQILVMDKKSSFRMSEANYMNDTAEGEKLKAVVLEPLNSIKQNKIPFIEKPFLASFVDQEKCNDLTLWRMYTKSDNIDGKGCAITLKTDVFLQNLKKTLTSSDDEGKTISNESISKLAVFENEFCLYRVAYLDEKGKCLKRGEKGKTLNNALEEIKKVFVNIKEDKDLIKIALERLSDIEYLFKGSEYQHESEVRLVLSKTGKQKHIKVSEEALSILPRTYMNTGNIIDALESITIGPKVERAKEWAAALNYKLQEFDKEDVSIYISQLPYK